MGKIHEPEPVKLFMGVIAVSDEFIEKAEEYALREWGAVDIRSEIIPFTFTDYYEKEMGKELKRRWFSIEPLMSPGELADIKVETNLIE